MTEHQLSELGQSLVAQSPWQQWLNRIFELAPEQRVPEHLIDIRCGYWWEWFDAGMSANDAVVRLRYQDACRKADRNA